MRRVCVLLGFVSMFAAGPAYPDDLPRTFREFLRAASDVIIPAEWDGVWAATDSTYICTVDDHPQHVASNVDTLCGGKPVSSLGQGATFSCSGSADANSMDVTCTASQDVFPNCARVLTFHIQSIRTGAHYDATFTALTHYEGTACGSPRDVCYRTASHANRIGPAPPSYCATPAQRTTWGRVKMIYR